MLESNLLHNSSLSWLKLQQFLLSNRNFHHLIIGYYRVAFRWRNDVGNMFNRGGKAWHHVDWSKRDWSFRRILTNLDNEQRIAKNERIKGYTVVFGLFISLWHGTIECPFKKFYKFSFHRCLPTFFNPGHPAIQNTWKSFKFLWFGWWCNPIPIFFLATSNQISTTIWAKFLLNFPAAQQHDWPNLIGHSYL